MVPADGALTGTRAPIRTWLIAALLLAALSGAYLGARMADIDVAGDLWSHTESISIGAARLRWGLVPVLAALTLAHYLSSSYCLRASAQGVHGRRLGLGIWEIANSQFAGAAANRLAPAGLGSAAVTCRYLTRRGLDCYEATAAVAFTGIVRGVTKLVLVVVAVATWSVTAKGGLPTVDLGRLVPRQSRILVPGAIVVGCTVIAIVVAAVCLRRRQAHVRVRGALTGIVRSFRQMFHTPRSMLESMAAATGAHVALALAFAFSVLAVPGVQTPPFGELLVVYLLGASVGAAIPTPAGVGSTEAALITVLTAVNVPVGDAAQAVLLFRFMTFWAPIPAGIVSARRLRRSGGL